MDYAGNKGLIGYAHNGLLFFVIFHDSSVHYLCVQIKVMGLILRQGYTFVLIHGHAKEVFIDWEGVTIMDQRVKFIAEFLNEFSPVNELRQHLALNRESLQTQCRPWFGQLSIFSLTVRENQKMSCHKVTVRGKRMVETKNEIKAIIKEKV